MTATATLTLTTLRKDNKLTMINYDTIISNFDDKVTLYNWLRKVEEALKNASATSFVVNKKGNATLSFSITFADGETLESGDIVLQQGESVDQARIASGILQLHLTNGTWLTAGNVKPVSNFNIDANQHLIVNYQDGTSQDLGAIFNGNVNIAGNFTANSIIENMTGYSAGKPTKENITTEYIYLGACKNGNKLTLVIFAKLTRTGTVQDGWMPFPSFTIPHDVYNKLFPYELPGTFQRELDIKNVPAWKNQTTHVDIAVDIQKNPYGDKVDYVLRGLNALEIDTPYWLRIEETFLLSDNLAL